MTPFLVTLAILAVSGLWLVTAYNRLVRLKNMAAEAWSGVDVQLKRRANLIPNLVETVKGYAGHEKAVFDRVTELRARSLSAGTVKEQEAAEKDLAQAIRGLMAVAEAYPDLKASQNFLDLSRSLAEAEEQIQLARRYYNGTARNMNIAVASVPTNLVASLFGFLGVDYFEIEDNADREVPKVSF